MELEKVTLSIIIVSYNVRDFLWQCLNSVKNAISDVPSEIIVVDNASHDGSVDVVKKYFPHVKLIENRTNVGFAQANNQAIRICNGVYCALINPDTLVQEDTFTNILDFFGEHADVGMVGCKILNPDGSLQLACRRSFPTPWVAFTRISGLSKLFPDSRTFGRYNLTYLDPDQTTEVEAISGSFMVVRKKVIDDIGLLDPTFFMYGEDLDWCFRIREGGWKIYYLPTTQIIHFKGESSRRSELDQLRLFYSAMGLFVQKHFGKGRALVPSFVLHAAIWIRAFLSFLGKIANTLFLPVWDLLLINVSLPVALHLRFGHLANWTAFSFVWASYSLIWLTSLGLFGSYTRWRFSAIRAFGAVILGLIFNSSLTFFFNQYAFSRAVVLIAGTTNIILLPGWRFLFKIFSRIGFGPLKGRLGNTLLKRRSVIVGDLSSANDLLKKLNGRLDNRYDILGIVTSDRLDVDSFSPKVLGALDSLDRIVAQQKINEIIFSTDKMSYEKILSVISDVKRPGLYFKLVPSNLEVIIGKSSIERIDDVPLLDIDYRLHQPGYRFLKRTIDVVISLICLVISSPMFIYFYFIKKHPVKTFSIRGADERMIRVFSFVEPFRKSEWWSKLPLLISVLFGHISLIGSTMTAPKTQNQQGKFTKLQLKPGVTGLSQLNQKPGMSDEDCYQYDLYYLKNYSPLLDLEIIFKSIFKM